MPREGASARASVHSCHIALYPRDLRGPEALKVSCHIACPRVCARAWQAALLLEEEDQSRSSQRASTSDKSRIKEWNNYISLGVAKLIPASEAKRLIARGAEVLPTQWIERDKNEFKRILDELIELDMKSRLVAREDLSRIWTRSDSPTADKECIFILFSFAASRKLRIKGGDIIQQQHRR